MTSINATRERKTERVPLTLTPSVLAALDRLADRDHRSRNDTVARLITAADNANGRNAR